MKLEDIKIGELYWFEDDLISRNLANGRDPQANEVQKDYLLMHCTVVKVIRNTNYINRGNFIEIESLDGKLNGEAYPSELRPIDET